jgi:hypothetical protein
VNANECSEAGAKSSVDGILTAAQSFDYAQGFVTASAAQPAAFQARVFPTYVDGVRADYTNQADVNAQREFKLSEHRWTMLFRLDALRCLVREQAAAVTQVRWNSFQ